MELTLFWVTFALIVGITAATGGRTAGPARRRRGSRERSRKAADRGR